MENTSLLELVSEQVRALHFTSIFTSVNSVDGKEMHSVTGWAREVDMMVLVFELPYKQENKKTVWDVARTMRELNGISLPIEMLRCGAEKVNAL